MANPYRNWSEIDPALPDKKIEVLGPPPTSGTRDAFVELVMDKGCQEFEAVTGLDLADGGARLLLHASLRAARLSRGRVP